MVDKTKEAPEAVTKESPPTQDRPEGESRTEEVSTEVSTEKTTTSEPRWAQGTAEPDKKG